MKRGVIAVAEGEVPNAHRRRLDLERVPSFATSVSDRLLAELLDSPDDDGAEGPCRNRDHSGWGGASTDSQGSARADTDVALVAPDLPHGLDAELALSGPDIDELSDDLMVQPDDLDDFEEQLAEQGVSAALFSPPGFLATAAADGDTLAWAHFSQDINTQPLNLLPASSAGMSFGLPDWYPSAMTLTNAGSLSSLGLPNGIGQAPGATDFGALQVHPHLAPQPQPQGAGRRTGLAGFVGPQVVPPPAPHTQGPFSLHASSPFPYPAPDVPAAPAGWLGPQATGVSDLFRLGSSNIAASPFEPLALAGPGFPPITSDFSGPSASGRLPSGLLLPGSSLLDFGQASLPYGGPNHMPPFQPVQPHPGLLSSLLQGSAASTPQCPPAHSQPMQLGEGVTSSGTTSLGMRRFAMATGRATPSSGSTGAPTSGVAGMLLPQGAPAGAAAGPAGFAGPRATGGGPGVGAVAGPGGAANPSVQCVAPDCTRRRQLAADGTFQYCRHHMLKAGGTPARPMCEVSGCERYARLSADPNAARRYCVKHMLAAGLQPLSSGPSCNHAGCTKLAQQSTSGEKLYCPLHMEHYGLQPEGVVCAHVGCCRLATFSMSGECTYCVWHMREHGQQPMARFVACEEPGCRRQSTLSSSGMRRYCRAHMGVHGLQPMVDTPCVVQGCDRQAMRGADAVGAAAGLCRQHARAAGVQLRGQVTCAHADCGKVAQYSTCGVRIYCDGHMRAHGLQPRPSRVCGHPGCSASARLATDGEAAYCRQHMAAAGLTAAPAAKKLCTHPHCTRCAKRGDDGQWLFCKTHQPERPAVASAAPAPTPTAAPAIAGRAAASSGGGATPAQDVGVHAGALTAPAARAAAWRGAGGSQGSANTSDAPAAAPATAHGSAAAHAPAGADASAAPAAQSGLGGGVLAPPPPPVTGPVAGAVTAPGAGHATGHAHGHVRGSRTTAHHEPQHKCEHEGCTLQGLQATDGVSYFCKEHMASRSLRAAPSAQRRCHKEGCTKWAKRSTTGVSLYCKAHMKEEGLQPTSSIKRCAHPGCTHAAKPDTASKWVYCKGHMQQYGMWPREYKSQPGQACRRSAGTKATSGTKGASPAFTPLMPPALPSVLGGPAEPHHPRLHISVPSVAAAPVAAVPPPVVSGAAMPTALPLPVPAGSIATTKPSRLGAGRGGAGRSRAGTASASHVLPAPPQVPQLPTGFENWTLETSGIDFAALGLSLGFGLPLGTSGGGSNNGMDLGVGTSMQPHSLAPCVRDS